MGPDLDAAVDHLANLGFDVRLARNANGVPVEDGLGPGAVEQLERPRHVGADSLQQTEGIATGSKMVLRTETSTLRRSTPPRTEPGDPLRVVGAD